MITWLNNLIQRRGRIVFIILLVVVTIAFVFTIGNTPGIVTDGGQGPRATFFGYDLNNPADLQKLTREATVSFVLQYGRPPFNERMLEQQIQFRTGAIALAAEMGIGDPSEAGLREFIESLPPFQGPDGTFQADRYAMTLEQLKTNPRITDDVIADTLVGDWKMEQILSGLSQVDLSLPVEVRRNALWRESQWDLAVARFSFETFETEITVDESDLAAYYEANAENYATPERLTIAFVRFEPNAFVGSVEEPDSETLFSYFLENSTRLGFRAEEVNKTESPASEESPDTLQAERKWLEDNRSTVLEAYRISEVGPILEHAAQDFTYQLYEQNIGYQSEQFFALLTEYGLQLETLEPLARNEIAGADLPVGPSTLVEAFTIPLQRYYSDPLEDGEAITVLFRAATTPASIPELETVREEVVADYREEERAKAFFDRGTEIQIALENAINSGTSFAEAAAAEGLTVQTFDDVSLRSPAPEIPRSVLQQLGTIHTKPVSQMLPEGDDGLFARVLGRTGPDATALETSESEIRDRIVAASHQQFTGLLLQEWLGRGVASFE